MNEAAAEMRSLQATLFEQIGKSLDRVESATTDLADDMKLVLGRLGAIESNMDAYGRDVGELKQTAKDLRADDEKIRENHAALKNRVTRLETMIVPGAALLSAIATALIGKFLH